MKTVKIAEKKCTLPSRTTVIFSRGPNFENSFSSSRSVVYKLKPNTPRQAEGDGASLSPMWRRRLDIGERLNENEIHICSNI